MKIIASAGQVGKSAGKAFATAGNSLVRLQRFLLGTRFIFIALTGPFLLFPLAYGLATIFRIEASPTPSVLGLGYAVTFTCLVLIVMLGLTFRSDKVNTWARSPVYRPWQLRRGQARLQQKYAVEVARKQEQNELKALTKETSEQFLTTAVNYFEQLKVPPLYAAYLASQLEAELLLKSKNPHFKP